MWGKLFLFVSLCAISASASATNFAVLLQGTGGDSGDVSSVDASKNIREIAIDELNIDVREMTTGLDVEYRRAQREGWRLYGPGKAHWGSAKFSVVAGASSELYNWWLDASRGREGGKDIRKNITVTLFKSDKTPGRSYTLFDCFPTQWSSVNFDTSSTVQTETLTVNIGRIEFKTRMAPDPGKGPVAVLGPQGTLVDSYDSWGGGEPNVILTSLFNSEKFHTNTPGHKSVGEITLRGAMTRDRGALCQWINDTVNDKPWKQMLTITEMLSNDGGVKDGKQYIYSDCFPCGYVFPRISVDGPPAEQLFEQITVKPIRVELK